VTLVSVCQFDARQSSLVNSVAEQGVSVCLLHENSFVDVLNLQPLLSEELGMSASRPDGTIPGLHDDSFWRRLPLTAAQQN
jgi:hypothetical protein